MILPSMITCISSKTAVATRYHIRFCIISCGNIIGKRTVLINILDGVYVIQVMAISCSMDREAYCFNKCIRWGGGWWVYVIQVMGCVPR
jgi:hypothetical protein